MPFFFAILFASFAMSSAKADSGECVSAASNITDEWCQAVKCAQVYIDSALSIYTWAHLTA